MGSRVLAAWECDRCGEVEQGPDAGYQPKGWASIMLIDPPAAVADGFRQTVCPTCRATFTAWWESRRPEYWKSAHIDGRADG